VQAFFVFINRTAKRKIMSPQAAWILKEEVVPRLRSAIPRTINQIGSEDAKELVQNSFCMAAKLLDNAEKCVSNPPIPTF
jgi:hypothetical protein